MGKVLSHMKRPFLYYNIESRAEKVISRDKPVPAPRHEANQAELERLMRENPKEFERSLQKHEQLDKHLKDVFVTSKRLIVNESKSNTSRPLPLNRHSYEEPAFGIVEPEKVGRGRVTLMNALKFVTDHHANPVGYNASVIAKNYSLQELTVKNILHYCRPFEVYIPDESKMKATFAGPTIKRVKVLQKPLKQISSEENKQKGET